MKFQWIGTGRRASNGVAQAARIAAITLMMLSSGVGYAADDDIPPPLEEGSAAPSPDVPNLENSDDYMPTPSLGDESLPDPSADRGQESSSNQVNTLPAEDEVFLPAPGNNEGLSYAPADRPSARYTIADESWQVMKDRPIFSLYAGAAFKSYQSDLVRQSRTTGSTVGFSIRMIDLAQTVFAHLYVDYSWYSVGDVGPGDATTVAQVKDETMHVGPVIEIGVGRRLSLIGSFLRRQARVSADRVGVLDVGNQNIRNLDNIGEEPTWRPGVGLQWDFYVIPHGSLGLRGHVEQDLYSLTLAVAMEPVPRKKLNLNFDDPY